MSELFTALLTLTGDRSGGEHSSDFVKENGNENGRVADGALAGVGSDGVLVSAPYRRVVQPDIHP